MQQLEMALYPEYYNVVTRGRSAHPSPLLSGFLDQSTSFCALALTQTKALDFFVKSHLRRELVECFGRVCSRGKDADENERP